MNTEVQITISKEGCIELLSILRGRQMVNKTAEVTGSDSNELSTKLSYAKPFDSCRQAREDQRSCRQKG